MKYGNKLKAPAGGITELPAFATRREIAAVLRLSETTFYRLERSGLGPRRVVMGRSVRFPRESVLEWIGAHTRDGM